MAWCFSELYLATIFHKELGYSPTNDWFEKFDQLKATQTAPLMPPLAMIIIAMASPHFLLLSDDADEVFVASCVALWQNMRWTEEGEILYANIILCTIINRLHLSWMKKAGAVCKSHCVLEKVCFPGSNQHYLVRGMNSYEFKRWPL